MPKNLYGVMVRWNIEPTPERISAVEMALAKVGDWLRFSHSNWVVWTDVTAIPIYSELTSVLTQSDSELVIKLDASDFTGWAPSWVDEWIKIRAAGGSALINVLRSTPPPSPPLPKLPWKP